MSTNKRVSYWNRIYQNTESGSLGWYEADFKKTLKLIHEMDLPERPITFISGCGTSLLPEVLLSMNHNLIINDVSTVALDKLKKLIGIDSAYLWLEQDIGMPLDLKEMTIDLWIDRAVLHFLTDQNQINQYFLNIKSYVRSGGWVHLAQFSKNGVSKCAGLDVKRYSVEELSICLGNDFNLMISKNYIYTNPEGGQRPYLYTSYKRL
jgi:hypothetical protein